jgi:hypothetical protein
VYRKLDPGRIVETSRVLRSRVEERFPASSLARVAGELLEVTQEAATLSAWLARPNYRLRVGVGAVIALLGGLLVTALVQFRGDLGARNFGELVQSLEAFVNDLVFVGIAVYFLWGLEVRGKRKRALEALHVLRSLAHIIDMHQLTKDPERLISRGLDTASSPTRTMTPFELTRYLDYSSEMLAIISKVAALYVQELPDPVTVDAASAVEDLAGGLSRTIWQKIVILDRIMTPDPSHEGAIEAAAS